MAASPIDSTASTNDHDFTRLWVGQSISLIGSQVTLLALPITAAITLSATPLQMGILSAIGSAPALLFGLLAGVWVDRNKRRPILIGSDLGRALVLAVIPLSALLGMLKVEVLYMAGFLAGTLGLFFNVAYRSYLPGLVGRDKLVRANSRLELSNSVAEIVGPGVAGGLVQLIGAPFAIAADALSFLFSAIFISSIRGSEPARENQAGGITVGKDIKDGLQLVFGEQRLRALAGCISCLYLFNAVFEAVLILYLTRSLGLSAGWLGVIFAGGSIGFVLGAIAAGWLTKKIGLGNSLVLGVIVTGGSDLLVPLAGRINVLWLVLAVLMLAQFFFGIGLTIFQIGQVSLRQSITPDAMQGRMNATLSVVGWGIAPLGGLLGGVLGQGLGLIPTLALSACGEMLAALWLVFSPVRTTRQTDSL